MGHCKLAGPTVWRSAGLLAACLAAVFLLRLPVLSASGSSGLSESGGSGSGAEESRGVYHPAFYFIAWQAEIAKAFDNVIDTDY